MIQVDRISKLTQQGEPLLTEVEMYVGKNEIAAIMGPSGSGKSALLECLALRTMWNQGVIHVKETALEAKQKVTGEVAKQVAYVPQQLQLPQEKTAIQAVLMGSRRHRPLWRKLLGSVSEAEYMSGMDALEKAGLLGKAQLKVRALSGGERQRVAIAQALVQETPILVLDEPVSNLDPQAARGIMEDLRKLCDAGRVTVICTLREPDLAERYANRIIGVVDGRVRVNAAGRRLTLQEKQILS